MGLVLNSGVQGKEFVMTDAQMFNYYSLTQNNLILGWIFNETPVPFDITWMLNDYISYGATKRYPIYKTGSYPIEVEFLRYNDGNTYVRLVGNSTLSITNFQTSNPPSSLRICIIMCSRTTPDNPTDDVTIYANLYDFNKVEMSVETLPASYGGIDGLCGTTLPDTSSAVSFELQSFDQSLLDYTTLYRSNYYSIRGITPRILYNVGTNVSKDLIKSIDGTTPEPYVPPAPPAPDDPNDEGEPSDEDGGDGDHDPTYDPVPIPDKPSDGVADAGFITLYRMTFREFDEFASKCFADTIWDAIKLKFNNPTDFLVGAMLLPFIPDVGLSYYPKFGLQTLDTAYPRINNQFHDIDCGSVVISKYWGSCFDYEPYTKIQIWLPYIGYKDLPVDEFMDMTINVKYRCDCLTGDCVAFVSTGVVGQSGPQIPRVIGQYYGNCGVRVPFGSQSFDAAVAAGITLIGAAAASGLVAAGSAAIGAESGAGVLMAAGAGAGSAATGAVGRSASVGVVQGMKPNVQHGGAAGASGGYMGIQTPYLIRRIPRQNLPEGFMNLKGYPSNIGGKLADFEGLAVVDEIQLNDIPAMETERKEIIDWLSGGVLI